MKAIVTTTIHPPTEAIMKYSAIEGWTLYIVGDQKTPHHLYEVGNWIYIHPDQQKIKYHNLSILLGWNNIQRRNIGFIQAFKDGADVIATVDDDNIPLENWGKDLYIGKKVEMSCHENRHGIFDPLSKTSISNYRHRGYPIQLSKKRFDNNTSKIKIDTKVQSNFWNGKPDVDAVSKLILGYEDVEITGEFPFCSNRTIFSSQNAFLHRDIMPHYAVIPFCGRMDDIWGCIVMQNRTNTNVVFDKPSTFHDRNYHHPIRDLEQEIVGYEKTLELLESGESVLPDKSRLFLDAYYKEMTC